MYKKAKKKKLINIASYIVKNSLKKSIVKLEKRVWRYHTLALKKKSHDFTQQLLFYYLKWEIYEYMLPHIVYINNL